MASILAAQLDELMGKNRNLAPDEKGNNQHWSDPEVCRYFLAGFCPNELFTNTRSDLGPCDKFHEEAVREEYRNSNRYGTMGYEEDFLRYLQSVLSDVDKRIRRGHSRLNLGSNKEREIPIKSDDEKCTVLNERIDTLLEEIEQLGSSGKVEEAQGVMKLCDQLKEEREQLLHSDGREYGLGSQEKQMEVCEVCGAFLIIGDAQSRVDDHLQGKQHQGYARIKSAVEEMKKRPWLDNLKEKDDPLKEKEAEESQDHVTEPATDKGQEKNRDRDSARDRDRYRDKDRDRNRDRDRSRDRGKDRDKNRDRDRGKDHDRDHERGRDRDRDRGKDRDRDRDRGKDSDRNRDRHRDRNRDRSRDKSRDRDRSRDRERDRKSRRDRDRNRDRDRQRDHSRDRDRSRERGRDRDRDRDRDGERKKDKELDGEKEPESETVKEQEEVKGKNEDENKEKEDEANHHGDQKDDAAANNLNDNEEDKDEQKEDEDKRSRHKGTKRSRSRSIERSKKEKRSSSDSPRCRSRSRSRS